MGVTYDGVLRISRDSGKARIEPCCRAMHERILDKQIYITNSANLGLRYKDAKGEVIHYCPFCGTRVVSP